MFLGLQLGVDGHYDLGSVGPGHCALGLSKGTTHTCLESISSSARQHLVGVDDMEGVGAALGCENHLCHSFSPCTCWHKYGQPPGL